MKKTLNVLGIIVAWLLSIVMVLMLLVMPVIFSALSMLNAQTVTEIVTDALNAGQETQPSAEEAKIVTLSNTNTNQSVDIKDIGGEVLAALFGDQISKEEISAILSSDVAKELIETYAGDMINVLTGEDQAAGFTAEKIKSLVNENIDEIVEILQTNVPEFANVDVAEIKGNIQQAIDENAEKIASAMPKPEQIKQQLTENNPALEAALEILAMKNTIKLSFICVIVVLSGLIFVCRIPGMRGFRWLAVNLFVGGGMNLFTTVGLLVSKSAVGEIAKTAGVHVASLIGSLLNAFTNGMLIRTVVMLLAGGALLTVYILLKKQKAKKLAAEIIPEELPAEEIPVEEPQV